MPSKYIPSRLIEQKIFIVRKHKVMLDKDLAELYNIGTRDLNKAVTRNLDRFPKDFMFRLNVSESKNLMFQSGTSSWGGTRKFPRAFTEQGVAMLSSVLNSKRAIQVNIAIMRAFVKLREMLVAHKDLAAKLRQLEQKVGKNDRKIQAVFEVIRRLMTVEEKPKHKIGFHNNRLK